MSKGRQNINIRISERSNNIGDGSCRLFNFVMRLSVDPDEEPNIRYAGIELQNTIASYLSKYDNSSSEIPSGGFVAMAALDIAYRNKLLENRNDYSGLLSALNELNSKAESLIDKPL